MNDRIVLDGMRFVGHHGTTEIERTLPQPLELDVELVLDLREAGERDDLTATVDYAQVYERCREVVEGRSFALTEAIAEAVASEVLSGWPVDEVVVRVRKLRVPLAGFLRSSGVQIVRRRGGA